MSVYSVFQAVTVTAGENALVAAVGMTGEDAIGVLKSQQTQLRESIATLTRISANMGAGANKTAIDNWIAALA